jgi:hypothetical protein
LDQSAGGQSNFDYGLSDPANVTAEIYSYATGAVIRTLPTVSGIAGNNSGNWDGRDAKGNVVPAGTYGIIIVATDAQGAVSYDDGTTDVVYCGDQQIASGSGVLGGEGAGGGMASFENILYYANLSGQQGSQQIQSLYMDNGQPTSWSPMVGLTSASFNGLINALALSEDGTTLYVGGKFSSVSGVTRNNLAAFDTTSGQLLGWNPNIGNNLGYAGIGNGSVKCLQVNNGLVYAGGAFNLANGSGQRASIAAFDEITGIATPFAPFISYGGGADYPIVTSISVDNGIVYFAGNFDNVNGFARLEFAAVSAATGVPTSWSFIEDSNFTTPVVSGIRRHIHKYRFCE